MTARLSPAEVLRSYRGVWLPAGRYIDLFERAYVSRFLRGRRSDAHRLA